MALLEPPILVQTIVQLVSSPGEDQHAPLACKIAYITCAQTDSASEWTLAGAPRACCLPEQYDAGMPIIKQPLSPPPFLMGHHAIHHQQLLGKDNQHTLQAECGDHAA